jgi:hypothetical protein
MVPNFFLAALGIRDDKRRPTQHLTLEGEQHPVEQTELRPSTGKHRKRPAFIPQPFPMHTLTRTVDLLAKCSIEALDDRELDTGKCRAHAQGEAERSERSGGRDGWQGMRRHASNLLAGRWLLAEEVHSMALSQQPCHEVTDLTLATAL